MIGSACGALTSSTPTEEGKIDHNANGPAEPVISRLLVSDRHALRHAGQVGERHR